MKAPFKWYGGKQSLAKKIIPHFPNHKVYVEPFCGAASLFFCKEPSWNEILNDVNLDLINFYKILQEKKTCDEFLRRLEFLPHSRDFYYECQEKITKNKCDDSTDQAVCFYVVFTQGFMGNYSKSFRTTPQRSYAQCNINTNENLKECVKRLQHATVENLPYQKVISLYDTKDTLFYVDPPYPETVLGHLSDTWSWEDFEELVGLLSEVEGYVVLSCNQNDYIPEGWKKIPLKVKKRFTKIAQREEWLCLCPKTQDFLQQESIF